MDVVFSGSTEQLDTILIQLVDFEINEFGREVDGFVRAILQVDAYKTRNRRDSQFLKRIAILFILGSYPETHDYTQVLTMLNPSRDAQTDRLLRICFRWLHQLGNDTIIYGKHSFEDYFNECKTVWKLV